MLADTNSQIGGAPFGSGEEKMPTKPQVIALEEHYLDPEVKPYITGPDVTRQPKVSARLDDVGQDRIAEMDAAGIDMQVLSHGAPSVQRLDAELAVRLAGGANDRGGSNRRGAPGPPPPRQ